MDKDEDVITKDIEQVAPGVSREICKKLQQTFDVKERPLSLQDLFCMLIDFVEERKLCTFEKKEHVLYSRI